MLCRRRVEIKFAKARVAGPHALAQSPTVPPGTAAVPSTVILNETVTNSDGRTWSAPGQTQAVRSDGATLLIMEGGSRQLQFPSGTSVRVSKPVAQQEHALHASPGHDRSRPEDELQRDALGTQA